MKPIHAILCALASLTATAAERPNILFLFSDDHAVKMLSAYAGEDALIQTPNIDRLANEGQLFERNYVTNSICGPSRATILTGKHSHINGMLGNERLFDGSQPTLPKYFSQAGYQTALIGKWHLVSEPTGFEHWIVLPGQGYYYNPDFRTPDGVIRIEGHSTDVITDLALDWLEEERDPDRPFLLMAQYKAPHRNFMPALRYLDDFEDTVFPEPVDLFQDPRHAGEPFAATNVSFRRDLWNDVDLKLPRGWGEAHAGKVWDRNFNRLTPEQRAAWDAAWEPRNAAFLAAAETMTDEELQRARYQRYIKEFARTVRGLDDNIGRILDYLDASGLAENTLVIYSTDQGFYLGERGLFDKRWMYEETFAMPFLLRWPGEVEPGGRVSELTQNLDYLPTLLEAAGIEIPGQIQGISLMPLLKDPTARLPRDAVYYSYHDDQVPHAKVPQHEGIQTDRYKLIYFPATERWELYDRETDPRERTNLALDPAHLELLNEMRAKFWQVRASYDAPEPNTLRPGPFAMPGRMTPAPYLGERYWEADD